MREKKQLSFELKQDAAVPGSVTAMFALYNVMDHDYDITLPGAIADGTQVRISSWGHKWMEHPTGRGVVRDTGAAALLEGVFFIEGSGFEETMAGREAYRTVKNLGNLQEWSYGYDVLDYSYEYRDGYEVRILKKLAPFEVSPVMLGAGSNTGTLDIKALKAAIASHSTDTVDEPWDGTAAQTALSNDDGEEVYRQAYAWRDPDGNPSAKASYKFIHHQVGEDGEVGPANIRACVTGIAILNGARGGTNIPDSDFRGVYNHLARHIRDAGGEPPELGKGLTMELRYALALDTIEDFMRDQKSLADMRSKEGRRLNQVNRERLVTMRGLAGQIQEGIDEMLADAGMAEETAAGTKAKVEEEAAQVVIAEELPDLSAEARALFAKFLRDQNETRRRLAGVYNAHGS